eukprot:scaffold12523_cov125-Isochrysis_galbana.AAC.3
MNAIHGNSLQLYIHGSDSSANIWAGTMDMAMTMAPTSSPIRSPLHVSIASLSPRVPSLSLILMANSNSVRVPRPCRHVLLIWPRLAPQARQPQSIVELVHRPEDVLPERPPPEGHGRNACKRLLAPLAKSRTPLRRCNTSVLAGAAQHQPSQCVHLAPPLKVEPRAHAVRDPAARRLALGGRRVAAVARSRCPPQAAHMARLVGPTMRRGDDGHEAAALQALADRAEQVLQHLLLETERVELLLTRMVGTGRVRLRPVRIGIVRGSGAAPRWAGSIPSRGGAVVSSRVCRRALPGELGEARAERVRVRRQQRVQRSRS